MLYTIALLINVTPEQYRNLNDNSSGMANIQNTPKPDTELNVNANNIIEQDQQHTALP